MSHAHIDQGLERGMGVAPIFIASLGRASRMRIGRLKRRGVSRHYITELLTEFGSGAGVRWDVDRTTLREI